MATRVPAPAGGNWTVPGTWVGGVAPTAADDVIPDAASGNVTVDAGAVCRSFDGNAYLGTLTHTASVNWLIGDGTAGAGNRALRFGAGMTYIVQGLTSSVINFASTSAIQQSIDFGGKTTSSVTFSGVGGSWILTSAHTTGSTATVNLTAGTLNTNGQTCVWGVFNTANSNVRTLTLGASSITLLGSASAWNCSSIANLTMTANTAVVTLSGATATFQGSAFNYNGLSIVFSGSGIATLSGGTGSTYANVTRTGTAVKGDSFNFSNSAQTITGTLTLTGNSASANRLLAQSSIVGTARTITAAAVSLTNVDFMDITGAGAAAPWTGTSLGDAGGNSGITFTPAATQTRNGAGGNWSDVARWTSRVPLPQDNVIVDSGSSGTITADMPRLGKDLTFTGFAGTWNLSLASQSAYGSLTLSSGMTIGGSNTLFVIGRGSHTITSAGKTMPWAVSVGAPGSTYALQDALNTALTVAVTDGTFNSGNFTLTCTSFTAASTRTTTVNLGTSTVNATGTTGSVWNTTATITVVNASAATLVIANTSASVRTINYGANSNSIGTINYTVAASVGQLQFAVSGGNPTIGTLNIGPGRSVQFNSGKVYTITNALNVGGTAGNIVTITTSTPGTPATLAMPNQRYRTDYLSLQDITVTGLGTYYAGSHSTNVSGNTGWLFADPTASTTSLASSPSMTSPTAKAVGATTSLSVGSQMTNTVGSQRSAAVSESVGASLTNSVASDRSVTTALQDAGLLTSQASISAFTTTHMIDAATLTNAAAGVASPPGRVTLGVSVAGVRVSDSLVGRVVVSDS